MIWISVDEKLPDNGEWVIAVRADGWWEKCQWSKQYGWIYRGMSQKIVKWAKVV